MRIFVNCYLKSEGSEDNEYRSAMFVFFIIPLHNMSLNEQYLMDIHFKIKQIHSLFIGHSLQNNKNKNIHTIIQNIKTLLEANLSASLLHDNSTTYNPLSSY